ncbi:MAG: hypothetical protein LBH36_02705 [Candidatus Nomurabacteria bacterium]|nr:hypothetical protein [Candidatus Nomurabacteria bacterium]
MGPEEDIERNPLQLREITLEDYNHDLSKERVETAQNILQQEMSNTRYDSFLLLKQAASYQDMLQASQSPHIEDVFRGSQGLTCVQMAELMKARFAEHGLKSHFVCFNTQGQINSPGHDYSPIGHIASAVPFDDSGQKQFLLADLGLAVPKVMTFPEGGSSKEYHYGDKKCQVIFTNTDEQKPYEIVISSYDPKAQEYHIADRASFDPFTALENPSVVTNDNMRTLPGFRTTKYDTDGRVLANISADLKKRSIKLKIMGDDGEYITKILSSNDDINTPEITQLLSRASNFLGETEEDLLGDLQVFREHGEEYYETVIAPSVKEQIRQEQILSKEKSEATDTNLKLFVKDVLSDFVSGEIDFHEHKYNVRFNLTGTSGEEILATPQQPIRHSSAYGEVVPTLRITDIAKMSHAIDSFLAACSQYQNLLWVKSRMNHSPEQIKKNLLTQIWFNATEADFANPEDFINRQERFVRDDKLDDYNRQHLSAPIPSLENCRLSTVRAEQSGSNESPYMLNFALNSETATYNLPSIRYATDGDAAYIFSIQKPKNIDQTDEDRLLAKKLNRRFFKLNKGVLDAESDEFKEYQRLRSDDALIGDEPYPENISDVTPASLISLLSTLDAMKSKGIITIKVPYFCPLRYQAHARLGLEEQERIQDNVSNKFLRTFRRLAFHFDSIKMSNIDKSGYTEIDIYALDIGNSDILNEVISAIKTPES